MSADPSRVYMGEFVQGVWHAEYGQGWWWPVFGTGRGLDAMDMCTFRDCWGYFPRRELVLIAK